MQDSARPKISPSDAPARIRRYNAGREPERLKLKYKGMRKRRSAFLRGTCHLFYEDWPRTSLLNSAPLAWLCGDLHFENFGAYKGDNRAVYFDITDFDEAVLAPCTWDVARFLTNVLVTARDNKLPTKDGKELCEVFLSNYFACLAQGKARWVERETAGKNIVGDLLRVLNDRTRAEFLTKHVKGRAGKRRLKPNHKRTLPIEVADRAEVEKAIARFARTQPEPKFFRVLDVARRIAGLGSLGVRRYAILVRGRGSPNNNYLLDLKEARPSALERYLPTPQPRWTNPAERVVTLERRIQAVSAAHLHTVSIGRTSFVLRELQPTEDRVRVGKWKQRRPVAETIATMGHLTAWAHLRTAGRQNAAVPDTLIDFAKAPGWRSRLFAYATSYSERVDRDWRAFCEALNAGFFEMQIRIPTEPERSRSGFGGSTSPARRLPSLI
jgi:uncharacterized protein (DUF2252 family)